MKTRRMNNDILEIYNDKNEKIFSIKEELVDGKMRMELDGKLQNEASHDFEDEVMASIFACKHIVIDFEKVSYIASMALKSLLSIQQIIDDMDDASMLLINVSEQVMDTFKELGFTEILDIEAKSVGEGE